MFSVWLLFLSMLSTIKIHMVPYKYTFLKFPTLAGESPKWNIVAVTWELFCDLPEIYALAHGSSAHVTPITFVF